jgi:hypothetical protein
VLALDARIRHVTLTWPWIAGVFLLGTTVLARVLARSQRL